MDKLKEVIFIPIGYYHPSQANWNYYIHIIIDSTGARMYRETFGGDSRLKERLEAEGYVVKVLFTGVGSSPEHKWKDIKGLQDIEKYNGYNWGEKSQEGGAE